MIKPQLQVQFAESIAVGLQYGHSSMVGGDGWRLKEIKAKCFKTI
jgi:hypothetical protein